MPDDADPGQVDPRITFAAERTALAWVRTGLALMGFGFVVARFSVIGAELGRGTAAPPRPDPAMGALGALMIAAGLVATGTAAARHVWTMRTLATGRPILPRPGAALAVAIVTTCLGLALLAAVAPALWR
jgi:putative membrane protein